jgi:hypothetical protein
MYLLSVRVLRLYCWDYCCVCVPCVHGVLFVLSFLQLLPMVCYYTFWIPSCLVVFGKPASTSMHHAVVVLCQVAANPHSVLPVRHCHTQTHTHTLTHLQRVCSWIFYLQEGIFRLKAAYFTT